MRLGAAVAHLCCDGSWRLLAVLLDGTLRLWDLSSRKLVVGANVSSLRGSEGAMGAGKSWGVGLESFSDCNLA